MLSRTNDDPLALIPTIHDDGDIPDLDGNDDDDDDDNDDNAQLAINSVRKFRAHKLAQATKGKSIDFDDDFQFVLVG
jgi:hypothetical protein